MSSQYDDDNKKGAWTPEEDELLKQLVAECGPKGWSQIARDVPGRSGKSCRLRCAIYIGFLLPPSPSLFLQGSSSWWQCAAEGLVTNCQQCAGPV